MPEQVLIMSTEDWRDSWVDPEYVLNSLKVEGSTARERLEKGLQFERDRDKDPKVIKKRTAISAKITEETGEEVIWGPTELDPGIKDIVTDLADAGYITTYSCEGRSKKHPGAFWETGVVGLAGEPSDMTKENREEIRSIVRENTTVPFRIESYKDKSTKSGAPPRPQLRIKFSRAL